ncbi:trypsin-like peptidase domain-containing protein [Piscinibacter sakaiensis]|uniref:Outer membrane stress sensor protease DegS n=1 Tax=Piscinibacter sakaiensis TaxID=1547922 RepID=A0A0K8NY48_PISS1|nr:trypsin-like peptidase domain-containing protein [Piscinibacter sakaiensis]GAP35298.1 outer membrane stress sensor protease DegS [Piscinibacter sakaiensis]
MRKTWLIFSQAVTVGVAMLFVIATLKPDWLGRGAGSPMPTVVSILTAPEAPASAASGAATGLMVSSYAPAARRATPAVVSVTASRASRRRGGDPWHDFFFGDPQADRQRGIGSAVIVSPDGYLLTNNHVVQGATDIEVQLSDGRQAVARLVGGDPETDVAVLKIDLEKLPVITFGDADALQVGDVVLAIGNPFGVGQTVTSGIVSALGRDQLGINTFENFIQTDAAINPGNSGGALVDVRGHLMGINTAIFSNSGGSLGIGFAIPVTTARQVMEGLIKDGMITRGWIGVEPRELTTDVARTFNLPVSEGVLITGVLQNGPAGAGGMRPGDVVTQVAGQPVRTPAQLRNAVSALKPRQEAVLQVQRGERSLALTLTIGERPRTAQAPAQR